MVKTVTTSPGLPWMEDVGIRTGKEDVDYEKRRLKQGKSAGTNDKAVVRLNIDWWSFIEEKKQSEVMFTNWLSGQL